MLFAELLLWAGLWLSSLIPILSLSCRAWPYLEGPALLTFTNFSPTRRRGTRWSWNPKHGPGARPPNSFHRKLGAQNMLACERNWCDHSSKCFELAKKCNRCWALNKQAWIHGSLLKENGLSETESGTVVSSEGN